MTVSYLFNKAADLLEKDGWIQGAFSSSEGYCVEGALNRITFHGDEASLSVRRKAYIILCDYIKEQPMKWNDKPGQTKENVIGTLRSLANLSAG